MIYLFCNKNKKSWSNNNNYNNNSVIPINIPAINLKILIDPHRMILTIITLTTIRTNKIRRGGINYIFYFFDCLLLVIIWLLSLIFHTFVILLSGQKTKILLDPWLDEVFKKFYFVWRWFCGFFLNFNGEIWMG